MLHALLAALCTSNTKHPCPWLILERIDLEIEHAATLSKLSEPNLCLRLDTDLMPGTGSESGSQAPQTCVLEPTPGGGALLVGPGGVGRGGVALEPRPLEEEQPGPAELLPH